MTPDGLALNPFEPSPQAFQSRLPAPGAAIAALIVLAIPANAECTSQIDANTSGMVVYKCDEPEGAADAALTDQLPANQTIVFKNGDARAVAVPDKIENSKPTVPEKKLTTAKSESKAKPLKKRKKKVAATKAPQRIIHINKPTLGQRIRKFFRFGSDSSDS